MKQCLTLLTCLAALTPIAQATVIDVARYPLGEAGSLNAPNNRPRDVLSTDAFVAEFINGGTVTVDTIVPGSTAALRMGTVPTGYYSAAGNGVFGGSNLGPTPDNFGVEVFVKADLGQPDNIFFSATGSDLSGSTGLIFEMRGGNWAAAVPGNDWIGAITGTGQTASGDWTSLAVIRNSGVSTFYINGVAQSRTTTVQPTFGGGFHLGVQSGGGQWFRGTMDELHVFTFNPGTDNPVAFLTPVPEPSIPFLLLGGLAVLGRRGRSRKA
jgi:hypothetical protein